MTKLSFSKSLSTLTVEGVTGEKAKAAHRYGRMLKDKTILFTVQANKLLNQEIPPKSKVLSLKINAVKLSFVLIIQWLR